MRHRLALLAALAVLGVVRAADTPQLTVQDAWVRVAPGADVAAVYLTLHNAGTGALVVSGVRSSIAGHAMIHETRLANGLSTMRPHERLTVPAGGTVRLSPGGLHVMLGMLGHPLVVGERVPLELLLEGGGTVALSALVRPLS